MSQYQVSVSNSPCAVLSPTASMSLMNTRSPAKCWPPAVMPNSAPCLMELTVSPPAFANPMILALEACACSSVALERVAERVVGGQEEPGVASGFDDCLAGAVRQHPGVVGPLHGIR